MQVNFLLEFSSRSSNASLFAAFEAYSKDSLPKNFELQSGLLKDSGKFVQVAGSPTGILRGREIQSIQNLLQNAR